MEIKSAEFVKGIVGPDKIFNDSRPQFALIGRSNVGKSSVINSLVNQKDLARTSSFPGRTREINFFLINNSFYLVDLPGYGYAQVKKEARLEIEALINWYFCLSGYGQDKIFLIIDAKVGPTKDDLEILSAFENYHKEIVVIANKIDKVKKSEFSQNWQKITAAIGDHLVIPYSAEKGIGRTELLKELEI